MPIQNKLEPNKKEEMIRVEMFRERSRKSVMMTRPSIFALQDQAPIVEEEESKQESESYDINASHISSS